MLSFSKGVRAAAAGLILGLTALAMPAQARAQVADSPGGDPAYGCWVIEVNCPRDGGPCTIEPPIQVPCDSI